MKIYAFHLLNDYSGSPKVLKQSIENWVCQGHDVTVVTCKEREGFLSEIDGVQYEYFWYKLGSSQFLKLLFLIWSQIFLFTKLILKVKKNDLIYINTVLPFGAAILGLVKRCRIIYHIHETSIRPLAFKKVLFGIVSLTAKEVIYVSNFLANQEKSNCKKTYILHNAIENKFLKIADTKIDKTSIDKNILMVCSLKTYKGVYEFVELSNRHEHYQFKLVVNASTSEVLEFFKEFELPKNLKIHSTQTNLHPFFQWADIVLNLSRPDEWVETFGLTIIEAMAYGLPVIVPPVGGVTELVEYGVNGYLVSSRELKEVSSKLDKIFNNKKLYLSMKENALKKIQNFKEDVFAQKSLQIIENKI